jgi:hypothetical protein
MGQIIIEAKIYSVLNLIDYVTSNRCVADFRITSVIMLILHIKLSYEILLKVALNTIILTPTPAILMAVDSNGS